MLGYPPISKTHVYFESSDVDAVFTLKLTILFDVTEFFKRVPEIVRSVIVAFSYYLVLVTPFTT